MSISGAAQGGSSGTVHHLPIQPRLVRAAWWLWPHPRLLCMCVGKEHAATHAEEPNTLFTLLCTCYVCCCRMATANQTYMDREQACGAVPEASAPQDPSLAAIASELSL